ncbi:MAG: peptidylprolyl isomerase [Ignavibacteria bacterium]|nr:peptidylprolyl isomerase [Ignavibacteria bacterium]MBK6760097.1 peptidylprolyl isomerase [Ignavibacteria bacterium]MBK7032660.1 peptidylprolyl isomerase [Ignavibacteria bacterium]MBK7412115.1 peptidylprolyl isomerase [Ignavibacteria bacterium]MBK7575904.1 peptidylprolyl isomerase [Ignavibacteria bacterium]
MTISAMTTNSRVLSIALGLVCIASIASAQKSKKSATPAKTSTPSTVIATVGTEKILLSDVERAFQKNLSRRDTKLTSVPRDTALEFLRLYTNYRLKVQDAHDRGLDKDSAVKVDLANNRKLLSETFFYDKAVADSRVDQLSRRRMKELQIGIILCAIADPQTKQWDTVGSKLKAERLIAQLNAGADFEKIARDSSDDKETAANGGILPWISGGSIIKAVEDEAYSLKAGQVSPKPVNSRFGYFVVKVFREEPRDQVKFRHILLSAKDGRDSAATDRFADTLITILKMKPAQQAAALRAMKIEPTGDAFSDLAKAVSDDKTSAAKGGFLGSSYSRSGGMDANGSRLVPAFENAVFALKDGELSGKVKTIYGTHIMIRDSTKKPDAVAERDAAKRTYRRLYFEEDKRIVLDSVKKHLGYQWMDQTLIMFMSAIDTTKNTQDTTWSRSLTPYQSEQIIYKMPRGPITVGQFRDSLRLRIDMRGYSLNRAGLERAMNRIADPLALEQATADLETKYPEFASLMQEFNDGILLFKVEEKEVWSKLRFDTTDARVFYDSTKSRWMTEQKYDLTELYVLSDSLAKALSDRIKKGENIATLAAQHTQREGGRDKNGAVKSASPKTSKVAAKITATTKVGDIIGPFAADAGWAVIRLDAVVPPQQKSFEAALSELAPAYQDALQKRLTENWLSGVRKLHPVVYDTAVIDKIWGKASSVKTK